MNDIRSTIGSDVGERPAGRGWIPSKRQALIGLAVAAVSGGAALNWSWLVAVGLAPLILFVLPCVVMCALGLCAMRSGGQACHGQGENKQPERAGSSGQDSPQPAEPSRPARTP